MASSAHTPSKTSVVGSMRDHNADIREGWVTAREISQDLGVPTRNVQVMLALLERRQRVKSRTRPDGQTYWQLHNGGRD